MSEKKKKQVEVFIVSSIMVLIPHVVTASPPPFYEQQKIVEEIAKDTSTSEKKAKIVAELMDIVNKGKDVHLRQFAAEKLGELEAVEAKDMLKTLAEKLEWTDSTRYLKGAIILAYWQIRVAEELTKEAQEELLIKLVKGGPPPNAPVVPSWAVDELSNRGVKRALPEIIRRIRSNYSGKYGEERIMLCTKKIQLISTNKSRQEALTEALLTEDKTQYQEIKTWAIKELGKLKTDESRWILINYALELQKKFYDDNQKWIGRRGDPEASNALEFYRNIIKILKKADMTDDEIQATGLRPDKFFISSLLN